MKRNANQLEQDIDRLLAAPDADAAALREALSGLWQHHQDMLHRLERITHISDAFQSMARQRELSLTERFDKELRQLERVVRVSDRYQQVMRELNLALQEAAMLDPLTALANRRPLTDRLKAEIERSERSGYTFCVAMLDIDGFKRINDSYGHDVGDNVLVKLARVLECEVREYDLCGRWGGEEFLVILPETDMESAAGIVQRIRDAVGNMQVRAGDEVLRVTVSAGIAAWHDGEAYGELLNRADAALLQAKRDGRDRQHLANGGSWT